MTFITLMNTLIVSQFWASPPLCPNSGESSPVSAAFPSRRHYSVDKWERAVWQRPRSHLRPRSLDRGGQHASGLERRDRAWRSPLRMPLPIYKKCFYGATLFFRLGLAILEVSGKHLQYSKFWDSDSNKNSKKPLLSSKTGMLVSYTPALFATISSFWLFPDGGIRFLMLKSAIAFHFLKRDLEVLFLHKFSGFMVLESAIIISTTYFTAAASMIYFHHLTRGLPEPSVDLKYLGAALSLVGLSGNFYHHYLLSKLRQKNDKGYKIPQGGLFNLVICPHYLFEIITFVGFSFISQTIYSYLCAVGVALYLLGRSYATRNWYILKFENFPESVKAFIPYVF